MESRGKAKKRTAFNLKLENYDDFEESYRTPKRCKTYQENYEADEKEKNVAEDYCDKITVIIKDVKEKRELEIYPDAFITELKEEVGKDFKIPYDQVSLYFNGKMLSNESTLSNSKIKDGSKVYVIRNSSQTTPDHSPLRSRKNNEVPNKEIEEEESSASFDNSTNAEGIVKSMLASGHKPDEINIVLFDKIFGCMETINNKINKIDQNLKCVVEILKQKEDEANKAAFQETHLLHDKMVLLPPHINLPLNSEDELNYFEQMLSADEKLTSNMVKYLYQSSHGKTPCSFLLNLTRLVLSQELASSYSRFGRKGKKSFLPYKSTTDIILAAASKKFSLDRDSLYEKFGRALANAPEWNGRKSRMQMMSANELNMSELTEISN